MCSVMMTVEIHQSSLKTSFVLIPGAEKLFSIENRGLLNLVLWSFEHNPSLFFNNILSQILYSNQASHFGVVGNKEASTTQKTLLIIWLNK